MAYWMVACSVYLYIAIFGANVRICRMALVETRGTVLPDEVDANAQTQVIG